MPIKLIQTDSDDVKLIQTNSDKIQKNSDRFRWIQKFLFMRGVYLFFYHLLQNIRLWVLV